MVETSGSLNGKVALITGAGRGLGRAIAHRLAREGAAVAIHYRHSAGGAESLATQLRAENRSVSLVRGDITHIAQVKSIVGQVVRDLGPISILVNNAVVFYPGELEDLQDGQMEAMWRTNVLAPVHLIQSVVEGMKEQQFGRIVNITSLASIGTAVPGTTFYAGTKAALATLTRRFAMDLGTHGITVNAVSPGFIPTEASMMGKTGEEGEARIALFSGRAMVRRKAPRKTSPTRSRSSVLPRRDSSPHRCSVWMAGAWTLSATPKGRHYPDPRAIPSRPKLKRTC
jgi:3-oxoacyl-[acyl-carrier protein] reductase